MDSCVSMLLNMPFHVDKLGAKNSLSVCHFLGSVWLLLAVYSSWLKVPLADLCIITPDDILYIHLW